jgi:hypothetical protein
MMLKGLQSRTCIAYVYFTMKLMCAHQIKALVLLTRRNANAANIDENCSLHLPWSVLAA